MNQFPRELWVVIDPSDNDSVYSAPYEEACHEHINEAIGEDIDGAGSWVVRRYVLGDTLREWKPHDGVEPAIEQNDSVIPIEIGVGKVRIATCWSTDDPQKVVRELVIYDDGGEQQTPGTEQPEHCGKRAWDVGRILARIRIANADGAHVLLNDLKQVIENARQADTPRAANS